MIYFLNGQARVIFSDKSMNDNVIEAKDRLTANMKKLTA